MEIVKRPGLRGEWDFNGPPPDHVQNSNIEYIFKDGTVRRGMHTRVVERNTPSVWRRAASQAGNPALAFTETAVAWRLVA